MTFLISLPVVNFWTCSSATSCRRYRNFRTRSIPVSFEGRVTPFRGSFSEVSGGLLGVLVVLCGLVLVDDLLGGLGRELRDDDSDDEREDESGEQGVQVGPFHERLPEHDDGESCDHGGQGALPVHAFPEQGEDHDRRERGSESGPCVGHQPHDVVATEQRQAHTDDGDHDDDAPCQPHQVPLGDVDLFGLGQDVVGHRGRGHQQLGAGGGHDRREDGCEHHSEDERGAGLEELLGRVHEDELGLLAGHVEDVHAVGGQVDPRHDTDEAHEGQGEDTPEQGHPAGDLDLGDLPDGHVPDHDVGHTVVAETPHQSRYHDGQRDGHTGVVEQAGVSRWCIPRCRRPPWS